MKHKPFRLFHNAWLQRIVYTLVVIVLILASIYQIYTLWSRLNTSSNKKISGSIPPDEEASLLEPFSIYLTYDGETYARLTTFSGHYGQLWRRARNLMDRMAARKPVLEEVENAPISCGLILQYACPLEEQAVLEFLGIHLEGCHIHEMVLVPAASRVDRPTLYLLDESGRQYALTANVTYNALVNRRLNDTFWDLGDQLPFEYLNAGTRFAGRFAIDLFLKQKESTDVYYIPSIRRSYLREDGSLDTEAASSFCMHFFSHPDVAKPVETSDSYVWFADEKRTVRYDQNGLLQYVATQEESEKAPVSLKEAYQLASGFLNADLKEDATRLQEVYLCDYEVDGDRYTFRWNYAYNHIPFSMQEENRVWTELEYPIEIIIEGSEVRYYHRYMLDASTAADALFLVQETYITALDALLTESDAQTPIESFGMEYAEEDGSMTLYWKVQIGGVVRMQKVLEVRV